MGDLKLCEELSSLILPVSRLLAAPCAAQISIDSCCRKTSTAGRGLVAENKIKPDTILISVPNKALVNTSTLQALYPVRVTRGLTSTQMISLHLALQIRRQQFPSSQRTSTTRDRYWPFLATLPRNFPTVPLTWMVGVMNEETLRREYNLGAEEAALAILDPRELDKWRTLVQLMPRSVSVRAIDVERRFKSDWVVVKKHWVCLMIEHFYPWLTTSPSVKAIRNRQGRRSACLRRLFVGMAQWYELRLYLI